MHKELIYNLIRFKTMKKFNLFMALVVAALSFVACNNKSDEPTPEPTPKPEVLTFNAEVLDITKTTATYSVTPSKLEAEYLVFVYDARVVEQCETDAEIITKLYDEVDAYAEANDTTFEAYLANKVKKGVVENGVISNLSQNTNYYLLIFGVDSANEFTTTSDVRKVRFKTEEAQTSGCTFEIRSEVYLNTVTLNVTPSDRTQLWHLINLPVEEYQKYTKAEGEYGWSQEEFFQNYLNTELETLEEQGLNEEQISIKLFYTGNRSLNAAGLLDKTKYVTLVAAVEYSAEGAYLTSAIKELRYTTGEAAENNLTFDVEVFNIDHYSAEVRITPSDPDADYYYYIGYVNSKKSNMKAVEIANSAVTEYIYYWDENNQLARREPCKGVVEFVGDNKLELDIAETEYYIVAFSFEPNPTYGTIINEETGEYDINPGVITSAPVFVSFMTADQGDPMTAEFEFKATDVGPYDFYLEITSSDPTVYYQPGIALAEGFNPQSAIDASSSLLAQLMQMCMEGQNPCLTRWEALETLCYNYYRNGNGKYYIANLNPEVDYIGYVLTIDAKTGTFVRCVYSDVIAHTVAVGSVTPTVELLGVYNGNDENGTIFGDADLTAGSPIIAVKHTGVENASALFCALSSDSYSDVNALSDRYIISEFRGYWQEVNLTVPYHFFVADWDYEQTVVSYAQDANGHEGKVGRLGVNPTTYGDINELKDYVDAVNAAMSKAKVQSLVFGNTFEPTMECIWSEEVGAPRAAEVIYHEVEPLQAAQSDVMTLRVVKSFAL